jgi:hypothetical protein
MKNGKILVVISRNLIQRINNMTNIKKNISNLNSNVNLDLCQEIGRR